MRRSLQQSGRSAAGFSLVELLVVMALTMIVSMAIVGIYRTTQQTASTEDRVVELQQNLRFALDQMARDIRMAGFMVDKGTAPSWTLRSAPATTVNDNATSCDDLGDSCFRIWTGTDTGRVARITGAAVVSGNTDLTVASVDMAALFAAADKAFVVRPANWSPVGGEQTVDSISGATITLAGLSGAQAGDLLIRIPAGAVYPRTISYFLFQGSLYRMVSDGNSDVVASGLNNLSFSYLLDDGSEVTAPATLSEVVAVRVTIAGTTPYLSPEYPAKPRQISELITLKNL